MCPDRKVDWFKENDFMRDEIRCLKASVIAHWIEKYGPDITAGEGGKTEQKVKVPHSL